MATKTEKQTPVFSLGPYPCGGGSLVEGAVWDNEIEIDGDKKIVSAVSFSRNYRDGDEWKKTKNLRVQDIPVLIHLLHQAQCFLLERSAKRSSNDDES